MVKTVKAHEKIMKTKNLTDRHFKDAEDHIFKFEKFIDNNNRAKLSESLKILGFIKLDIELIKNFMNHNFEESFKIAKSMKPGNKEMIINRQIDCLMEIKSRFSSEDFQKQYGDDEIILKTKVNSDSCYDNVGINMALAFGSYLDGNKEEMNVYLNRQLKQQNLSEILKEQGEQNQPWFYDNVSQKYILFLNSLCDEHSINPIGKKMKAI